MSRVREVAAVVNSEHVGLTAVGTILRVAQRYVLVLRISEDNRVTQTRQIAARDCADLAGAAAVVLALALKEASTSTEDSGAVARQAPLAPESSSTESETRETTEPEGESESPRERAPATTAAAPVPENTQATPRTDAVPGASASAAETVSLQPDSWFWLSLPQVGTALGGMPEPGIQFGAGFVARYEAWGLCLLGRYEVPHSIQAVAVPNVGARVARYFAEATLFHAFRTGAWEWAPGLVGGVMVMDARGSGVDITPSRARAALGYVGANASLRWYAARWMVISGGLSAHAFSVRPRVAVSSLGEVRKLGPGQIVLSVGSEWNF